jgi:uncharacterized protein YjbJ (UPF0337 family)
MLNAQKLQGSWNQLRGKVKEHWGNLTDDDLRIGEGNIDQLIGRIQHKTGETRDAIERWLSDLTEQGGSMVSNVAQAVSHTAGMASDRLRQHFGEVSDQAEYGYEQARQMIRQRPAQSVAAVFGVGLGLGLLLGLTLRSR